MRQRITAMILAGALALTASGCSLLGGSGKSLVIDTEDGIPFIEVIGEYADTQQGTEHETEEYYEVIPESEAQEASEQPKAESEAQEASEQPTSESEAQEAPEQPTSESEVQEETEQSDEARAAQGPLAQILDLIAPREERGEIWAYAYEDLESGASYTYRAEEKLQSASVVKLFIMGAVYQYMCYPEDEASMINFGESYSGELRETLEKMITVSDNDAANRLITALGEGDFALGAERIGTFCEANGYTETSIGRRFLEENPTGDNYTSASDVTKLLSDVYHGRLVNEEASGKMLDILKGQTRKNKIPAGLPEGYTAANKTGEMPEGYGLGCIENDAAIVFPPEGTGNPFVLSVLSNELAGRNEEAITLIAQIASTTAAWSAAAQD